MFSPECCDISNIKCHFSIHLKQCGYIESRLDPNNTLKRHGNFFSFKNKYSYIVFSKKNFVNVTGIKKIEDVEDVKNNLCLLVNGLTLQDCSELVIDNITSSGCLNVRIDLNKCLHFLRDREVKCHHNSMYFPGLFIKFLEHGRVIVFSSGKFSMIGMKCQKDVNKNFSALSAHMNRFLSENVKEA